MAAHDLRTFYQTVGARMAKTGSTDLEHIQRSAFDAIRFYRDTRFDFNEAQATFLTVDGTATYSAGSGANDYPADLMFIDKAQITISSAFRDLTPRTVNWVREHRWNSTTKSKPTDYAWSRKLMDLYPTPDGAYTVTLDYVKDVGTPTYEHDGTNWTFYDEDGAVITATYASSWFSDGKDLIGARVEWDLWTGVYKDLERGVAAKYRERDALAELKAKRGRDTQTIPRDMHL